jgi:glucose 1-dehydrogenase
MASVALITGAAGGIGGAAVRAFHQAGWSVLATDRRREGIPQEADHGFAADVSREEDVLQLVESIGKVTDRLDALVNNAAIQIFKSLLEMKSEEWDATMASNLRAAYLTARSAHPMLAEAKGSIVNVSSVHAVATSRDIAAYAASKGGLVALTRAMALEFAPFGIRVNAVLPGAVDTPMLRDSLQRDIVTGSTPEGRIDELGRRTPLGRVARPEEIAESILFLADGRRASFITGQTLIVDGGATARLSTE